MIEVVVEQSCDKVICRCYGVEIASEVEVDILRRQHLSVATSGCTTLHTEARAQRWLTQSDHCALADAVLDGKIGAIGVDVYSKEPFSEEHPYSKIKGRDNVIFTPHMAWGSYEARKRCCEEVALNIEAYLNGERRCRLV